MDLRDISLKRLDSTCAIQRNYFFVPGDSYPVTPKKYDVSGC